MQLTNHQRRFLRGIAQQRKPVVTLGVKGLTPAVMAEVEQALAQHELLKIKLPAGDKKTRLGLYAELCERTQSAPVQAIGRTAVIYRPAKTPRLMLPRED